MNFKKIKSYIPLPTLVPLNTFGSRFITKLLFVYKTLEKLINLKLRRIGARSIGKNQIGNEMMCLNRDSAVGKKGFVVEIAKDEVIFEEFRLSGAWEYHISEFLLQGIEKLSSKNNSTTVMVDIGANCGLISLQVMNLLKSPAKFFLIEPLHRHMHALRNNLQEMSKINLINLYEFGLSDKNIESNIYSEVMNQGNSTLFPDLIASDKSEVTKVFLKDTESFCEDFLSLNARYVIKSDTQGSDALILSRIPSEIWQRVECAVIEIWAVPSINENDVVNLLAMWSKFSSIEWSDNSSTERDVVSLGDVEKFWLSKSGIEKNIFLS
jgi:FkbM family methyltransferase